MPTLHLSSLEFPISFPRLSSDFLATYRILLALSVVIFVLATVLRATLFSAKRSKEPVILVDVKEAQSTETAPKEKALASPPQSAEASLASATPAVPTSVTTTAPKPKSSWGWFTWESLPALPVSLTVPESHNNRVIGQGVGLMNTINRTSSRSSASTPPPPPPPASSSTRQQQQNSVHVQSLRRGAPVFDRPLPSIYQTQVPMSMAKIIMSRHTHRRPGAVRPPPPTNSTVPLHPSSRRHASTMV
ncbi:hypothetical protein AX16_007159 [Volvariella volvacea WC 439]|nr:hypothetical protein AX16_007159 [Volvariella volvacea WC 439]